MKITSGIARHRKSLLRSEIKRCSAAAALATLLLYLAMSGMAPVSRAEEEEPALPEVLISAQQLADSVSMALAGNQAELTDLERQLQQLNTLQAVIDNKIKAHESQNAAHGQLLLATQLPIEDLEKALSENRLASKIMTDRTATFQERHETVTIMIQASKDRRGFAREQIDSISGSQFTNDEKQQLEAKTRELIQILDNKIRLGERYLEISGELLERMVAAIEDKKKIGAQLIAQLDSRKKASFFLRTDPFRYFKWPSVQEAFRSFGSRLGMVLKPAAWKARWSQAKMGGLARVAIFLAGLAAILTLQGRCRSYMQRAEQQCEGPGWFHRCLGLLLLRRSLTYLGMTVLFGLYTYFQFSLIGIGLSRLFFEFFLALLITRWGLDGLDHGFTGPPTVLRDFVVRRLKQLIHIFRATVILVLVLRWIAGIDSLLTGLAWDLAVTVYLVWFVVFWQQIKPVVAAGVRDGQAAPDPKRMAMLRGGSYIVVGGSLLLSLLGYNALANHWITGWIDTIVLLFWGWISLNAIREWHSDHEAQAAAADEDHIVGTTHPWRWSMIQLVRFVWIFILAAGLLWSWDSGGYLQAHLGRLIGSTVAVGKVSLSIKGILMTASDAIEPIRSNA